MRKSTIALLLLSSLAGCRKAAPSDLVGTWVVEDASRAFLPAGSTKTLPTIVLDSNGTFTASGLPRETLVPTPQGVRGQLAMHTGGGVWRIVSDNSSQYIQMTFNRMAGRTAGDLPYGIQVGISISWSDPELYYFLGDADLGRRISFERKKEDRGR